MSDNKKKFDVNAIVQEVGKFTRKVNSVSKFLDYAAEEVMPKLFKENLEKANKDLHKQIGYIIKHLI